MRWNGCINIIGRHPPRRRGIHAVERLRVASNRALDLRLRGDDNGVVAWMDAMYPHHNVILPFMG
jgi:hypothetical protein